MPSSGSVIITTTAQELINDAARNLTVLAIGQTLRADHNNYMLRALNRITAQIGPFDFGVGGNEWTRREATLFLQPGQADYTLGPTGDAAADANAYSDRLTTVASLAAATTITLDSVTNAVNGDVIGIELESGAWQWTTIQSFVAMTKVVTLVDALTADVAIGARVVYFTHQMRRPEQIDVLNLRDANGIEKPLSRMNRDTYAQIENKTDEGDPVQFYTEAQIENSRLSIWPVPETLDKTLKIYYLSPVETFLTFPNNPDFPIQWHRTLMWALVKECAPYFKRPFTAEMQANYDTAMQIAQHVEPEKVDVWFEPNRE